jgi:hypothetical protein
MSRTLLQRRWACEQIADGCCGTPARSQGVRQGVKRWWVRGRLPDTSSTSTVPSCEQAARPNRRYRASCGGSAGSRLAVASSQRSAPRAWPGSAGPHCQGRCRIRGWSGLPATAWTRARHAAGRPDAAAAATAPLWVPQRPGPGRCNAPRAWTGSALGSWLGRAGKLTTLSSVSQSPDVHFLPHDSARVSAECPAVRDHGAHPGAHPTYPQEPTIQLLILVSTAPRLHRAACASKIREDRIEQANLLNHAAPAWEAQPESAYSHTTGRRASHS